MISHKLKIILDGTVLGMAIDNKLARTGIYFVIKNLCDSLLLRNDLEFKILAPVELRKKMISFYSNHRFEECFDLTNVKLGEEKLNFIMPFHPAGQDLYKIPKSNIFQIIYDFSIHFCPELKGSNISFEKNILKSLNSKSHALCISKKTRSDLLSISNIEPNKVGVFYPGLRNDFDKNYKTKIDINKFLNIPENSKYILCLSTLEPRKNLRTSIEIFERMILNSNFDNLYLVLTGAKGWGKIDEQINTFSNKIKKKIIITGYVDDNIVYHLYKSSLCFLYPSFYEGFGLPPLEAMAAGTPVIISNRGSLPEIFGKATKVFDPYDITGMTSKIHYLYLNSKKREEEGNKLKKFSKLFTWKKSSEEIISFIKKFKKI